MVASVPEARDGKRPPGLMGGSAFIPRFRNLKKDEKRDFIKGYCVIIGSGGSAAPTLFADYGEALQKKLDHYAGSCVSGSIFGERAARFENHVRHQQERVRRVGHSGAAHRSQRQRQRTQHGEGRREYDRGVVPCRRLGHHFEDSTNFYPPGYSIHEVGTCRMGDNPKTSVLNKCSQSHDIKNLFVVDGASFVTCGWQNPTMTILALSMRASEYLADQMKKRNI